MITTTATTFNSYSNNNDDLTVVFFISNNSNTNKDNNNNGHDIQRQQHTALFGTFYNSEEDFVVSRDATPNQQQRSAKSVINLFKNC